MTPEIVKRRRAPTGRHIILHGNKQVGKQKGNAAPSWGRGDDGIVKLTPATERHVHFPASMHDVPSRGEAEGLRLRTRLEWVLGNLKVVC